MSRRRRPLRGIRRWAPRVPALRRAGPARRRRWRPLCAWGAVLAVAVAVAGCQLGARAPAPATLGGDAELGRELLAERGCAACHVIAGVRGADGTVGPSLERFGERSWIAGALVNNEDNLVRWIRDPDGVRPGTPMPDLGVSESEARSMAAYLLSLR